MPLCIKLFFFLDMSDSISVLRIIFVTIFFPLCPLIVCMRALLVITLFYFRWIIGCWISLYPTPPPPHTTPTSPLLLSLHPLPSSPPPPPLPSSSPSPLLSIYWNFSFYTIVCHITLLRQQVFLLLRLYSQLKSFPSICKTFRNHFLFLVFFLIK